MKRTDFFKKSLIGMGSLVAVPTVLHACSQDKDPVNEEEALVDCELSPSETTGPFTIKTPSQLMRENIVGDRSGIAMLITISVLDKSNNCNPLPNVFVDIWHCDAQGYYSEYGNTSLQEEDFTQSHFLRGRQTTDANGNASFISIFPGWYPGRAPHIHLEVLAANETSIRVSQIAFPKTVCDTVYTSTGYKGEADTLNTGDSVFSDGVNGNMTDSLTGNNTDGYTLLKTIVV